MAETIRLQQDQRHSLRLTPALVQGLAIANLSNQELTFALELSSAAIPGLTLSLPAGRPAFPVGVGGAALTTDIPQAASSLFDHAYGQARLILRTERDLQIAAALTEALEPCGWMTTPLQHVAERAACSLPEVTAVLERLQEMEPAGLFARSLAECLCLQAREAGFLDAAFVAVLERLDLVAAGRIADLSRESGIPVAEVTVRLRQLRRFDPKPGARFLDGPVIAQPDLVLSQTGGVWSVDWCRGSLPGLMVDHSRPIDSDLRHRMTRDALADARAIERAVALRNANGLAIVGEIVRRQSAHLADPTTPLTPLTRTDIAEALGLHQSSVARIVQHLTLQTPAGLVPVRRLFSRRVGRRGHSAAAVRAHIAGLIASEPSDAPLSDTAISARLARDEMAVPRRTVAAHRQAMAVPPQHARKRRAAAPST